jgi:hypothetical protein
LLSLEAWSLEIEQWSFREDLEETLSSCRWLHYSLYKFIVICIADYTILPSALQLEAACPIVPIEELLESLSEALEITHLGREIEVCLSESLGIRLEEVSAHYF